MSVGVGALGIAVARDGGRGGVDGARQLRVAPRLHVASVVLVKVVQLIVDVDWLLHLHLRGECYDAGGRRATILDHAAGIDGAFTIVLLAHLYDAVRDEEEAHANPDKGDTDSEEGDDDPNGRQNGLPGLRMLRRGRREGGVRVEITRVCTLFLSLTLSCESFAPHPLILLDPWIKQIQLEELTLNFCWKKAESIGIGKGGKHKGNE